MAHNTAAIVELEAFEATERARRDFEKNNEPEPTPIEYTEVLPFPVEVFPATVRQLVEEGAKSINCPIDFLGVPLLALAGTAIGTSRSLRIKNGWVEGPRIYAAIVDDPGGAKTPALNLVSTPLEKRQRLLQAEYEFAKEQYEEATTEYEADLESWKKKKKKDRGDRPEKPKEPVMGQVKTTDATMEALSDVLAQNPRGILFHRDELAGWVRSMDQYKGGKGSDRQNWLSFWSGESVLINRKSLKEPLILNNPFVNVAGAIQPDVLNELTDERGREDGFIHRILFSFPGRVVTDRWTDAEVSPATLEAFQRVFDTLWNLKGREVVPFTTEGKALWVEWYNSHAMEQDEPSFPDNLRGPWAKMKGYCARIALILHMCRFASEEVASEEVDEYSMAGAAELIDYFKSHAKKVYARLKASPEDKRMIGAIEWIKRQGGKVTAREVRTYKVAGVKNSDEAKELLRELEERGAGKVEDGPRKSVIFTLSVTQHSADEA